jgi:ribosomal protein S18 acetylase RimI-like enzyme
VGAELTRARLQWIAERADEAFYFTQEENHASIALHAPFGFREVSRAVEYPRALGPSSGRVLYRVELSSVSGR